MAAVEDGVNVERRVPAEAAGLGGDESAIFRGAGHEPQLIRSLWYAVYEVLSLQSRVNLEEVTRLRPVDRAYGPAG
jgi:hypothetical protein